jgi:hypothetical protein
MFVSFYTILKQRLKIVWKGTPTNFSYEPPLLASLPKGLKRNLRELSHRMFVRAE